MMRKFIPLSQNEIFRRDPAYIVSTFLITCNALRDFLPFVQFRKHEKHASRSVTFRNVAGLLKVTLLYGC